MSEGNTEKGQYVNIENYLSRTETSGSWADETEEDHERESKPRAWAVPSVVDEAPNLLAIQAEEQKRAAEASKLAAEAAKRAPYRTPQKSHQSSSYDNPERHSSYESRSSNYDRPPREKQPIPTEPPFTAFIGNLAYDVSEEDITEYFGELGVVSIRLLKDPGTGKPKGYGYIEFQTAEGLVNGLLANENKLKGRAMNLDVAKPQQASSNSWGSSRTGDRDRNSSSRPSFNKDTSWGPGPGGRESFNKDNRPSSFNRPPPSNDQRPKLNINTPSSLSKPPQSPREPPKNKPSHESIFGSSIDEDEVKKMNKISEERLKREMEREAQKRELEKRDRDKVVPRNPRTPGRGDTQPEDSRFNSSWRGGKGSTTTTSVKPPYNMNYSRQGQDDNSRPQSARGPQKSVVDSEGFRGQNTRPTGHTRAWENQGSSSRPRDQEAQTKNSNPKEIQNKFASLEGDEEE